jgi:hypothetical protein
MVKELGMGDKIEKMDFVVCSMFGVLFMRKHVQNGLAHI